MKVKKRMNQLWIVAALFIGLNTAVQAQGYLQANGHVIVNGDGDTVLLRSIGLGGWMLQEGYMLQTSGFANPQYEIRAAIEELIGVANTDTFYTEWLNNYTTRADVEAIAAAGFNSIRLPMHYNLYTPSIQDEVVQGQITWLDKGFDLTDSMLAWCKDNNLYLILDLHAAPGGQGHDQGISDYNPAFPSLWQSEYNRAKTVALWYKLAERYVNEEMIGGYDLINETNWELPGGTALKNLYKRITDTIRLVDNNHIIFIEGNWFANDFTGLTPAWDANMAYSFHKYWSINNLPSISGYIGMRNTTNRPLWCGEAGENSNVWYTSAAQLFEENSIGWAWWTWKKFESTSGLTSVITTAGYNTLLNYWNNGGTKPTETFAKDALMEMTEQIKLGNCKINSTVSNALIHQVATPETTPFISNTIPGLLYATDFDFGRNNFAYYDIDTNTLHVSTGGGFTAWNNGYSYRNDAVDIEANTDVINSNGFNVGWTNPGEWLKYSVDIDSSAAYNIIYRHAGPAANSQIRFTLDDIDISGLLVPSSTGGWATFKSDTIKNVILEEGNHALKLHFDKSGVNISSFLFEITDSIKNVAFTAISASVDEDGSSILLTLNKALAEDLNSATTEFSVVVNGTLATVTNILADENSDKIIRMNLDSKVNYQDVITLDYSGTSIESLTGEILAGLNDYPVVNNLPLAYNIEGRVQAENFFEQAGIEFIGTKGTDKELGIGYLDANDYALYRVKVNRTYDYSINLRVASQSGGGRVTLTLIDNEGNESIILNNKSITGSGGWETWKTVTDTTSLTEGFYTLKVQVNAAGFNLNWIEFIERDPVSNLELFSKEKIDVYPNPANTELYVDFGKLASVSNATIEVLDITGKLIHSESYSAKGFTNYALDVSHMDNGIYLITIQSELMSYTSKFVIKH